MLVVNHPQYQSPTLTAANWALLQSIVLWPGGAGWFSDEARQPGGVAYAVAYAIACQIEMLDANLQIELAAARVQSSTGPDIDTWFYDFLGTFVTRFPGQDDDDWRALGLAILALQRNVIPSIQFIVQAFYAAIQGTFLKGPNLGHDTAGGMDTSGGMDVAFQDPNASLANPAIYVWDKMTRPDLAALYGIAEPQFVIQIGTPNTAAQALGFDTQGGFDTSGAMDDPPGSAYSLTNGAPDPRLAQLVNFVKAAGTEPMYFVFHS
ncbi:MAG: hypothetical protein KGL39_32920 [Patescibacteria group bacterium]|nr:hypothetical protein [Patescibacteria group bacterium]